MRSALVLLVCGFVLFPVSSDGRTWLVRQDGSGDCTTIQACVDSAAAGDSVLVYPGLYEEHVSVSRTISLIGLSGSNGTIIDGNRTDRCVLFDRIPSPGVVLKGFTVRNGEMQTPPTSFFNTVGGGIFSKGSAAVVSDCVLEQNRGGGIACDDTSNMVIENNLIQESISTYAEPPYPGYGAGVITRSSNTVIRENTFLNNQDDDVLIQASSPQVIRNRCLGTPYFGGITGAGTAYIAENLITGCLNPVGLWGSCEFTRNTVVNNRGTGIFVGAGHSPVISNNIVVGNSKGIDCSQGGSPSLYCNDVWNNTNDYSGSNRCYGWDLFDFHLDPQFCDPGADNFYLKCTSPCAGHPDCGQVGALPVACGPTVVREATWGRIKVLYR